MSVQFPPPSNSPPASALTGVQSLTSSSPSSQQPFTASSISPAPNPPSFCDWIMGWIRRIFFCFFSSSGSKPANPPQSLPPMNPVPSVPISSAKATTATTAPALNALEGRVASSVPIPLAEPIARTGSPSLDTPARPVASSSPPVPPAKPKTLTTVSATSPTTTAPALNTLKLDTLKGRVAAATIIIDEHLTKNTPDREMALDKTVPEKQWGIVVQLKYNGQERVFAKNWDGDMRTFLINQAKAFLSNSKNRDQSNGFFHIESIIFQKTNDSQINYFNPYTVLAFPDGTRSGSEMHQKNTPIGTLKSRMCMFLPIVSERTTILKIFDQLPELHTNPIPPSDNF